MYKSGLKAPSISSRVYRVLGHGVIGTRPSQGGRSSHISLFHVSSIQAESTFMNKKPLSLSHGLVSAGGTDQRHKRMLQSASYCVIKRLRALLLWKWDLGSDETHASSPLSQAERTDLHRASATSAFSSSLATRGHSRDLLRLQYTPRTPVVTQHTEGSH